MFFSMNIKIKQNSTLNKNKCSYKSQLFIWLDPECARCRDHRMGIENGKKKKKSWSLKWISFRIDLKLLQLPFPWKLTFMMVFGPCVCACVFTHVSFAEVCMCVLYLFGSDFGSHPYHAMHTETCRSGTGIKVRPGKQCRDTPKTWLSAEFGNVLQYLSPKDRARSYPSCLLRDPRLESLGMPILLKRLRGLLAQIRGLL